MDNSGSFVRISVSDDGQGISADNADKIFLPFYQVKGDKIIKEGTGLGLAYARSLAELIGAEIYLDDRADSGAIFNVKIPVQTFKNTVQEFDPQIDVLSDALDLPDFLNEQYNSANPLDISTNLPEILIVDDNEDLRFFLRKNLSKKFHITQAANGIEALKILNEKDIDLIISDIIMPEMDGLSLCDTVKSSLQTSHIPIILLTAKSSIESEIEGLKHKADAYLAKPFSLKHLETRVVNLLEIREDLKKKFSNQAMFEYGDIANSKMDKEFVDRITGFIESNLSEQDMTVKTVADFMNLSTSGLYKKLKGISGLTPNEFIRLVRLKKAASLLSAGEYRVNEICYIVGFNSPSWFAKCFANQFHVLPSDFVKKNE